MTPRKPPGTSRPSSHGSTDPIDDLSNYREFVARLPDWLFDALVACAALEGNSRQRTLRRALAAHVARRGFGPPGTSSSVQLPSQGVLRASQEA